jgi:hypothetical protein
MLATRRSAPALAWFSLLVFAVGCDGRGTAGGGRAPSEPPPLGGEDRVVYQKLESDVNTIVNDESVRYTSLQYQYSENLLDILDQVEKTLAGKAAGEPRRFLPRLSEQEERDHFRETVRRWEAQTGKNLRAEVDALKADVAARPSGVTYYPEFQRKFSKVFDSFVALEVAELRERRNRAIHAATEARLAPLRDKHPEPVRRIEAILNQPPYQLSSPGNPKPAEAGPTPAKP